MNYYSDIRKKREKRISGINKNTQIKEIYKIRFLSSAFLLIIVYLIFQMSHPYALKVQDLIKESLTREYNFSGVYNIYKDKFSGNPAIIPTLVKKDKSQFENYAFIPPFQGSSRSIRNTDDGIIVVLGNENEVVAIGEGLVINIEDNLSNGYSVKIRHSSGIIATYEALSNLTVQKNDWVEKGQLIGLADNELHLALLYENEYLNPLEVISFENKNHN